MPVTPPTDFKQVPMLDHEHLEMMVGSPETADRSLLAELLDLFLVEARPAYEELKQAAEDQDVEVFVQRAHFLAGCSANLGLSRLSALMRQLQRQAEETALIPTFEEEKTPSEVLSASITAYKATYQVDE